MPIGRIEIMNSQEATQIKHMESHRVQHAQEQQSKNFQNMITQEQYKPTEAAKSDNNEYRYDAKEKGNNKYNGSGGKKQKKQEEKKETKPAGLQQGSSFDILI
jgi:hypothetical protein